MYWLRLWDRVGGIYSNWDKMSFLRAPLDFLFNFNFQRFTNTKCIYMRAKVLEPGTRKALFFLDVIWECSNTMTQPDGHLITVFEVQWRISDEAYTFRSASEDDRTGFQGGPLREEGDGLANIENLITNSCIKKVECSGPKTEKKLIYLRRGTILNNVSIQGQLEFNTLRVRNQVVGHKARA